MTPQRMLNRRDFIKVSAAAGGGLLVSLFFVSCAGETDETPSPTGTQTPAEAATQTPLSAPPNPEILFEPGMFLKIDCNGDVT